VRTTFAIVGAGPAGGTAAATLRQEGFDGRIVLIGDEELPPYERPPLSKEYLRGEHPIEDVFLRPPGWYEEHDIERVPGGRADRIDVDARVVELAHGRRVSFDQALIATGARNRRIDVAGADLEGVLDLRRVEDSDGIREAARAGARVIVVGMGFIGAEVAASLRQLGCHVTVVEVFQTAMLRVLGPELGRVLEEIHRDHGVVMHFGEGVERFEGGGRVGAIVTTSGRRLECDVAVVGVGVQPNAEIAARAGLPAPNGIAVGPTLETAAPGIFATGDVALHDHPRFGPIRVEHHDNALKMGQAAARNMLGASHHFDDPHWFWSDQYDVNIQMAGVAASWDDVVIRGTVKGRSFSAFFLRSGALLSALSLNRPRDVRRAMPLIRAGARPDRAALGDEDVDLRTLARVST
jgi:3-phenylpropionate/trans-cinnamate dioxygenase ferredoxin reductase component